ncbi:hypothetical protein roselon_00758 [Roseibacterium elongatum DSM 19469]|uniref:Peptidoglycan binding-like domain-containing protein n=1 Tax=Roseicyclus elongatus DSM 19469 TaxID=1294273 RepID=W8S342_9RHOB|nr:peptidoglycan-binding domain-containing protein [Roseibacterium elongatum]AHM03176.1 hypothetical protein roselon_00758 [Roseibacterium elongatum DSM 19469]
MRARPFALALLLSLPGPVAADTALLIASARYDNAQNLRETRVMSRLEGQLRGAGFDVISVGNGTAEELRAGLSRLLEAEEDTRVVIAATGHFATGGGETWLLGREANAPDLAEVSGVGLPLSILQQVAASAPGRALVLLGVEERRMPLGRGLNRGVGVLAPPQGVTVIRGATRELVDLMQDGVLRPGVDLAAALRRARGLQVAGFVSGAVPFLDDAPASDDRPPRPQPTPQPSPDETALWEAAQELDTPAAYRAYLQRYPDGAFADLARLRAEAPQPTPEEIAQAAEEALGLDRDGRRQVQRHLTILGYDTRGVDGIFGTGTRTAIRAWQGAQNVAVTGYLDAPQLAALRAQGRAREAALAEEERERRAAEERADRAFWQATGQGQTVEGLRRYLDRYPEGLFADEARSRLQSILQVDEDAAWRLTQQRDTVSAYRAYLQNFPNGRRADIARNRIDELESGLSAQDRARLEAQEAALNLQPVTRSLIEQRLQRLGLEPGRVDGRFDAQTRAAIRRYQRARGLRETGYLDQVLVVRLLAESIGGILR